MDVYGRIPFTFLKNVSCAIVNQKMFKHEGRKIKILDPFPKALLSALLTLLNICGRVCQSKVHVYGPTKGTFRPNAMEASGACDFHVFLI